MTCMFASEKLSKVAVFVMQEQIHKHLYMLGGERERERENTLQQW